MPACRNIFLNPDFAVENMGLIKSSFLFPEPFTETTP